MSTYSHSSDAPEPRDALSEIERVQKRIRMRRWWYVAGSMVMACSLTIFYIAIHAWPDLLATWFLTFAVIMTGLVALLHRLGRSVPATATKWENRTLWISLGLVLVCVPIYRLLLPDGFSLWLLAVGLLPGLPHAVLAWRVSRS